MKLVYQGRLKSSNRGFHNKGTKFQFQDGQIWLQDEYKYKYHYSVSANASIYESGGKFYLEIDGINEKVLVKKR